MTKKMKKEMDNYIFEVSKTITVNIVLTCHECNLNMIIIGALAKCIKCNKTVRIEISK